MTFFILFNIIIHAMLLNVGKAKISSGKAYPFESSVTIDNSYLQDRGCEVVGPVKVKGEVVYKNAILLMTATAQCLLSCRCDNCGKELEKELQFDMQEEFVEDYDSTSPEDYVISQITIDLDRPVLDNLLFNLPSRILCKENCKGLCSVCGKDKNLYSCNCEAIEIEEQKQEQNPFNKLKNRR